MGFNNLSGGNADMLHSDRRAVRLLWQPLPVGAVPIVTLGHRAALLGHPALSPPEHGLHGRATAHYISHSLKNILPFWTVLQSEQHAVSSGRR